MELEEEIILALSRETSATGRSSFLLDEVTHLSSCRLLVKLTRRPREVRRREGVGREFEGGSQ